MYPDSEARSSPAPRPFPFLRMSAPISLLSYAGIGAAFAAISAHHHPVERDTIEGAAGRKLMASAQQLIAPRPIAQRPLRLAEVPEPPPGPGEISIEVAACGVCRTDLQIVEGDLEPRVLPIVPGHQIVGRVRTVGDGVDRWAPGQRVGVGWLAGACGTCDRCRSGEENLCPSAEFTGWDRDGGFANFVTARADYAYPVPSAFGDVEAAPLLSGGVIGDRARGVFQPLSPPVAALQDGLRARFDPRGILNPGLMARAA